LTKEASIKTKNASKNRQSYQTKKRLTRVGRIKRINQSKRKTNEVKQQLSKEASIKTKKYVQKKEK
jgi:hypothetical protein